MNNERYNQIIKEVYIKYLDYLNEHQIYGAWYDDEKSFEKECKADKEFAEIWGLQIEERELDMMERWELADLTPNMTEFDYCNKLCDEHKVPTKLITTTYKGQKIEVYE